jgi:hypothetical protein
LKLPALLNIIGLKECDSRNQQRSGIRNLTVESSFNRVKISYFDIRI